MDMLMNFGQGLFGSLWVAVWTLVKIVLIVAPLMLVGVVKLAPTLPLDGNFPFLHLDRKFMQFQEWFSRAGHGRGAANSARGPKTTGCAGTDRRAQH